MLQVELIARKKIVTVYLNHAQISKSTFLRKQLDTIQTTQGMLVDHNVSKITFILDKSMFYEALLILANYLESDTLPLTIQSKSHWSIAVASIFECSQLVAHIHKLVQQPM